MMSLVTNAFLTHTMHGANAPPQLIKAQTLGEIHTVTEAIITILP